MSFTGVFNTVRYLLLLALTLLVWLILGMVYFDRFIPPSDHLRPLLMPWKKLYTMPVTASLEERISIMQGLLHESNRISDIAFPIMIVSFTMLSVYLTLIYQQKLKRSRENRLLQLKNQEIARRNEFIRFISATIGHEFKNNLGRIKRRIDLLKELPADVRMHIDDNLDKLFADIDIFKKISDEREAGLIDFTKVDLTAMLEGLAAQYNDFADISLKDSAIRPPVIFASQTLLRTVFENLIDNSIKYKKPDQSRARISISCSIDVDVSRRYVSLSFRDMGMGMDELQAGKCFYKGKSTQEGWGEGLYFTKYVIGLHAGKIRVGKEYTATDKGVEIIINLPFVEESLYV